MAKRQQKKDKSSKRPAGEASGRFRRYCYICLLTALVVLAWVSLLTYNPYDPPSPLRYPDNSAVQNRAGVVGSYLAFGLRYYLGSGAYMGLLFASVAACLLMIGSRIRDIAWRMFGVVLLILATSAAAYLVNPSANVDIANSSAGLTGRCTGYVLLDKFGNLGAWLVVTFSLAAGLMLAADHLVLKLPGLGKAIWRRTGEQIPAAIAVLRPVSPSPVTAEASPVTSSTRALTTVGGSARPVVSKSPRAQKADRTEDPEFRPADPAKASPPAKVDKPSSAGLHEERTAGTVATFVEASPKALSPVKLVPRLAPAPVVPAPPKPACKPVGRTDNAPAIAPDSSQRYSLPSASLLAEPSGGYLQSQEAQAEQKRAVLQQTLNDFGVSAEVVGHMTGPVITLFELALAPGVKVAQVANLANDIARALAVPGVRIVSPIPGKDTVGIEVPNLQKEIVRIRELMGMEPQAQHKMHLPLYLGKDAGGGAIVADLSRMPHMLIAGTTGSGKSVCINAIIMSLLLTRTPEQVRLILVDPKMVEMAAFENLPHLLCPVVNDMRRAEDILEWAATKMDERYELLKEAGVKNIAGFNALPKEEIYKRFDVQDEQEKLRVPTRLQYYVIIIDELADLVMTSSKEVEGHIIRIAQKARAVGIHLILATQRPSVNVVTGLIKSNMPCRISFRVASRQESRIVLDQNGADVLMGQGDMLFLQPGTSNLIRAQGTFVDDSEIRTVMEALRKTGPPDYHSELVKLGSAGTDEGASGERDELFDKAVEVVLASQRGSVSLLQRRLQIGYSRSSRIIDQMADAGILGDYKGSQARECNMTLEDWQALKGHVAADQSGASSANGEPTSA